MYPVAFPRPAFHGSSGVTTVVGFLADGAPTGSGSQPGSAGVTASTGFGAPTGLSVSGFASIGLAPLGPSSVGSGSGPFPGSSPSSPNHTASGMHSMRSLRPAMRIWRTGESFWSCMV